MLSNLKDYTEISKVEKLSSEDFSKLINELFSAIENLKVTREVINQIWNNIYKDIFDRNEYQDNDIVELHCRYRELMQEFKNQLPEVEKEIKVIPVIEDTNELELLILENVKENNNNLKNLTFKMSRSTVYNKKYSRIKEDLGKYLIIEETYHSDFSDNDFEYRESYFVITYKVRFIKSKDETKFINVEKVEVK